jgi:RNA polymerase primary sigma factor
MQNLNGKTETLDGPRKSTSDLAFSEIIPDPQAESPFSNLDKSLCGQILKKALGKLDKRDLRILTLRFGLGESKSHTLEEIGRLLKITRERVLQLQKCALARLKLHSHRLDLHVATRAGMRMEDFNMYMAQKEKYIKNKKGEPSYAL